MDQSSVHSVPAIEEDDWDTDGFVIPSITVEESDQSKLDEPEVLELKLSSPKVVKPKEMATYMLYSPPPLQIQVAKEEEKMYLGPHGAPPSQAKQQELNFSGHKQRFKQKLKEADRKSTGSGRENKVENLRELVGSKTSAATMPKGSSRDWLDPHCRESQFQRYSN